MRSSFLGVPVRKLSFSLPPSLPPFLPSFHCDSLISLPKATQLIGGGIKLEAQT